MDSKNTKYLIFAVILLILSVIGIFVMFQINSSPLSLFLSVNTDNNTTIIPTSAPTSIQTSKITPTITASASAKISTSSAIKTTITPTITATPTAVPTTKTTPTSIPTVTATPTPLASGLTTYKSTSDAFSIQYSTSRKIYQDSESTGTRYTFYSSLGNFAVHVAPSGTWSWTNPDRNFSSALIISGQNTYRYDIDTQTIVDLQSTTKNYTIQCVHNGKAALKTECEAFIKSFTLL